MTVQSRMDPVDSTHRTSLAYQRLCILESFYDDLARRCRCWRLDDIALKASGNRPKTICQLLRGLVRE